MPVSTGYKKVQTNTMKVYRRPQRYTYHHSQLGHVSPGLSLLVSVCVLMLPMLGLVDEHAQLTTMYHMSPIHQCYYHPCQMTFGHAPLILPSLNNVLPTMALQNRVARSSIGCPSYTSSQSDVHHCSPVLHLNLPSGLGRRVVGVVLILLLLLSGDIETNPGPVSQQLTVDDLRVLMKDLNDVRAKWYNIGVQLGMSVGTLKAIEKQYSDPSDCLRETLTTWLKSSTPMWTNIVDALNVVGEVRVAADLQHKYCSTQHIAATHHHVPPVPAIPPAQAHTWMTPALQSTVPLTQPPAVLTSPYSVPPQPHPSHFLPWSVPYYYPPPTSYPASTPSLPPPTSYPLSTPSLPPPTSYPVSTPSLLPTTSYPVSTPSLPPPTSYPVSTPSLLPPTSYPVSTPSLPPTTSYPVSTPSLPPTTSYPVSTPSLPPPTSYPVSTPSLPPPTSYPVSTPSLPPPTSYPVSTPSLPPPTSYPVSTPSLPPPTSYPVSTPSLPPPTSYPVSTPSLPPTTSYPVSTPSLSPPTSYPVSTPSLPSPPSGAASTATSLSAYSQLPHITPDPTPSSPPTPVPVQPTNLPSDAVQSMTIQPDVAARLSGTQFQEYLVSATIPERIQTMEMKFDQLVDKVQDGLLEQNIPLQRLKRCITRLPASIKYQHVAFVEEKLKAITHSESMEEIFGVLNLYWDFLNYTLLEHIVINFGNNDTKAAMANYISGLVTFRKATNLSDFITHWPCTGKVPPDMSKLVIKMEKDWSNCTLEDVEQFRRTLTQKLLLPSFAVVLRDAEQGCISLTWLIPSSVVKILSKDIHNTKLDWFKEHHIERLAIDEQDLYSSATFGYSTFLRKLYTSQKPPLTLISSPLPLKLFPFKLARIEKEKADLYSDEFTRWYLREDMDDVGSRGTIYKKSPIEFEEVGKLSSHHQQKLVLIEGAPGVGKTTFSWEFCRKWSRGEILQGHSLLLLLPLRDNSLKAAKALSDLFYHPNSELQQAVVQEVTSNQGKGVAIWLEAWDELDHEPREKVSVFLNLIHGRTLPLATVFVTSRPWASEHLRQSCGNRITQHVEILTSAKDQIEHYISKAEAKTQPSSFAAKFTDYLSSNPAIRVTMYTPVTAKMAAKVFTWTESPPPTTMTELFTAFTLKTLVNHLSTHLVDYKQQVTTFSELPTDVYKQLLGLCRMAYEGILNRQQLVFSPAHLPTGFTPLGLMHEVPQLYTEDRASSYHFIHLTLQEYLAAIHISRLPSPDQTKLVREHFDSGHFKMTIRFLAGLTKLANIPPDITKKLMESDDTKLICFHFLFEAKDISMTARTLGSDEIVVESHYSWTPLDYYVIGHAISHSNCPWKLNFNNYFMDDERFELFCQGCAAPGGTGYISHANFSGSEITSRSIQSFLKIPPHILRNMRKLYLRHNKLDGSACDLLAKVVPSMSELRILLLGGNPIDSGGAVEVIKALCGNEMKQLWLYNTGIGEPDCEALCELLKSSHSLQELNIPLNNLSSESVASIITGLGHNSSLTTLNISNSHFSKWNVDTLASVLRDQSKCVLTSLYLDDCCISGQGACELAAALYKNSTLKELSISHNTIGVEGVTAVAKLLLKNKTLTHLVLRDCHISGQGASELTAALCKNSTLKHLYLDHNPIGVEGASSMSDMLQHNTSLEYLHLCDDSVKEEGVHQLINSLKHNQTLRDLYLPKKYKSETSDDRIYWQ